jgi:hypothetical protein
MGYTPKHAKPDSLDDATTDGSPSDGSPREQSATSEPSPGRHAADDIRQGEDTTVPKPRPGDS